MMVFRNFKRITCLMVCLALCAGAAQAIEVKLENGDTITATQVEWDGTQFTITAGMKTKVPATRVSYLKLDESVLDMLRERASGLERDKKSLDKDIDALTRQSGREKMRANKAEADVAALQKQIGEYELARPVVSAMQKELSDLKTSNRERLETITELRKELAEAKKKAAAPQKTLAKKSLFKITEETHKASAIPGLLDTQGRIRNTTSVDVDLVLLEVSALDKNGKLLAMATTFVINFKARSIRSFKTDLEADSTKVAKVEVAVADVVVKIKP